MRASFHIYTCAYTRNNGSAEKMTFVVEESGKENVVPVRLLSRERLGFLNADCVIGNGQGNASPQKQRRKGKRD